ncbi:dTMP kinase [Saxibacter everestensis]|uniref:Thymidylate kinase n=1 Tax=Saxibacter everestensis TaxID=2909229 RepID=A0ABY8QRV1_9MICO|nr:dTMP kinase [Brevibacteriaceae bacterium ZFBP1038]
MNIPSRRDPTRLSIGVLESAGWLGLLLLVGIGYVVGGSVGLGAPSDGTFPPAISGEDISVRAGAGALLALLVLYCVAWLLPVRVWQQLSYRLGQAVLIAGLAGLSALSFVLIPVVGRLWWVWIAALLLGATTRVATLAESESPQAWHRETTIWRALSIAATVLTAGALTAQFMLGPEGGLRSATWLGYLVAAGMLTGAVAAFYVPWRVSKPSSGASRVHGEHRPHAGRVSPPKTWGAGAILALLGATAVLSQPVVAELGGGQAGFGFIVLLLALGMGLGIATSSRTLPGLSRPRLVGLALVAAGLLTLAQGVVQELTAVAVLGAVLGWLAGVAIVAQLAQTDQLEPSQSSTPARGPFSRLQVHNWSAAGAGVALLIALTELSGSATVSENVTWQISPSSSVFLILGVAGVVAGIAAIVVLDPRRLRDMGQEIRSAWTKPVDSEADRGNLADSEAGGGNLALTMAEHPESGGLFIAFEGGDGAGKSTQLKAIDRWLREDLGLSVVLTREPGGTPEGVRLRDIVLGADGVAPRAEALLFAADRGHHVNRLIRPALGKHSVVLTDRYMDSSIAYQGAGRDFDAGEIAQLSWWATEGLRPALTVLLDVDPEVARARRAGRGAEDHLERKSPDFHSRVRERFLSLADQNPDRYLILDAGEPAELLTEQIQAALLPLISSADLAEAGESLSAPPSESMPGRGGQVVPRPAEFPVASAPNPASPRPGVSPTSAPARPASGSEPNGAPARPAAPVRPPAGTTAGPETEVFEQVRPPAGVMAGPETEVFEQVGPLVEPTFDNNETQVIPTIPDSGPAAVSTEPVEILDALSMQRARLSAQAEAERAARQQRRNTNRGQ